MEDRQMDLVDCQAELMTLEQDRAIKASHINLEVSSLFMVFKLWDKTKSPRRIQKEKMYLVFSNIQTLNVRDWAKE